jgi:hypothetical protein
MHTGQRWTRLAALLVLSSAIAGAYATGSTGDNGRSGSGSMAAVRVGGEVAAMRPGFVSFNLDFSNRPSQLQAGFFTVNFSNPCVNPYLSSQPVISAPRSCRCRRWSCQSV